MALAASVLVLVHVRRAAAVTALVEVFTGIS